jgi:hypothetical protein
MDAFDEDVRDIVKVHVVHGFWKQEDASRRVLKVSTFLYVVSLRSISNPSKLLLCFLDAKVRL